MRKRFAPAVTLTALIALPAPSCGQAKAAFIKAAEGGAPPAISAQATIARIDTVKKTAEVVRQGTNGFTCTVIPDGTNAPYCGDQHAWQWLLDAFGGKPKPTNTVPGVAYMAQGGKHFETSDGQTVMMPGANTKTVDEPPHWMLLWPVDPATTGLPTKPVPGGVYVMFHGTPYAHLMVYQDPKQIVR